MSEGCHLEPDAVAVAKTGRCATPVFVPIEVERTMMRAGQRQDVMCLWRSLRSLGLVDCSGGPWVGNEEREPGEERNQEG
jgi:hypothetical protein